MTRAVVITMIVVAGVVHAQPTQPTVVGPAPAVADHHRTARMIGAGLTLGLTLTSEVLLKDRLAPAACRWCAVNSLDDRVHGALAWGDRTRAGLWSNITADALEPVGLLGLLWLSSRDRADPWVGFGDDVLAVVEATAYTQLVVQVVKFSVGRQRPYAHYQSPGSAVPTNDDNLSFLSGHSALTFTIATTAGVIAHARRYAYEPVIWATGMTLAATTAYLRMAAEKHYLTDVLAGSALGAAMGLLVPRITGALPVDVAVVPTGNGLALSGTF